MSATGIETDAAINVLTMLGLRKVKQTPPKPVTRQRIVNLIAVHILEYIKSDRKHIGYKGSLDRGTIIYEIARAFQYRSDESVSLDMYIMIASVVFVFKRLYGMDRKWLLRRFNESTSKFQPTPYGMLESVLAGCGFDMPSRPVLQKITMFHRIACGFVSRSHRWHSIGGDGDYTLARVRGVYF